MSAEALTLPIEISIYNQGQIKGGITHVFLFYFIRSYPNVVGVIFRPMKLYKSKIAMKAIKKILNDNYS